MYVIVRDPTVADIVAVIGRDGMIIIPVVAIYHIVCRSLIGCRIRFFYFCDIIEPSLPSSKIFSALGIKWRYTCCILVVSGGSAFTRAYCSVQISLCHIEPESIAHTVEVDVEHRFSLRGDFNSILDGVDFGEGEARERIG